NFGGTGYSGTASPGHNAGAVSGTNWNTLAVDTLSGIVDQNGNATSIGIDFSRAIADESTTVDYGLSTKAADYASVKSGYTLFDSGLGKSNAVRDGSGLRGVGIALTGLTPGDYDFYLTTF